MTVVRSADLPFEAGAANSITYTPATYPVVGLTVTVTRDGAAVTPVGSLTADAANECYTLALTTAESVAGLFKFAFSDGNTFFVHCMTAGSVPLLATATDLVAFDHLDETGDPIGYKKLGRASARVRRYARQDVTRVTGDVVTGLDDPYVLPQRPVISVASVVDEDDNTLVADTDYVLRGNRLVMSPSYGPVTVTYTHGFSVVPEEIREVVCSIAVRMQDAPQGLKTGVQSENAAGTSFSWGRDAYAGVADLTPDEKRVVDGFFPKLGMSVDVL